MKIKKLLALSASALMCVSLFACGGAASSSNDSSSSASNGVSQDSASKSSAGDNTGKKVSVNYIGTLDDGTKFDSSYDRNQTLDFTVGAGQMISGFDNAVKDMKVGEKKKIHLEPAEAYGERNEQLVQTIDKSKISGGDSVKVGDTLVVTISGQQRQAKITAIDGDKVTIDANHEMAGKALNFEIELVSIND